MVAKVASDQAKPNGILWVLPGEEARFLAPLDIRKIPGVGKVTEKNLQGWGIRKVGDLAALESEFLREHFGQWGLALAGKSRGLDAGGWFDPIYAGTKVPLLSEALNIIQNGSVTLIERKSGEPSACIKLLREKELINRVVVQSFDWDYLQAFHHQEPRQILGALGPPHRLADSRRPSGHRKLSPHCLDELQKSGARVAVWNRQVSKESLRLAHARGLKVWVYTINDPQLANRLLDIGVDGLITNNTSLIRRTIALRSP